METKADEETTGEWIEILQPIGACSLCIHQKECKLIKHQTAQCHAAKYRFRCPIEIFVPEGVQHG
jgi:hypothetical protein